MGSPGHDPYVVTASDHEGHLEGEGGGLSSLTEFRLVFSTYHLGSDFSSPLASIAQVAIVNVRVCS